MVKREKIEALVFSRRNIGEADRLVTLFSRSRGLLKVVAKGVRTVPSRRGGHVEPFTKILAIVSGRPGRYYLAGVETEDYYSELREDAEALMRAHLLARVVMGLFEEEDKQEGLFGAWQDGWRVLPQYNQGRRSLLEIALYLMALQKAGLMPQLGACQKCGARAADVVVLDDYSGGWMCLTCRTSLAEAKNSVTGDGLKVLKYLASHPEKALRLSVDELDIEQVLMAVRNYVGGVVLQHSGGAPVKNMY